MRRRRSRSSPRVRSTRECERSAAHSAEKLALFSRISSSLWRARAAPSCSRCLPPPLPRPRSINGMLSARRAGGSSSAYLTSAGRGQWLFPDDARSLELGAVIDMATDARAVSGDSGSAFAAPARTRGDLARAARGSSTATRVARRSRTSPSTPRGHARRLAPDVEHGDALDGGRCTAGWRPGKLL